MLTAGRISNDATLEPPVLEIGVVVGDRYEVECLLGAGTFAQVYRAKDLLVPDHSVSLKISRDPATDDQAVGAAMRELQLIASVFHPSVVQLKDHGWHESRLWFVMPLYRGETLATRLSRGALSRREAREVFEALAEALATLHAAGVRHQDIKPDNIFLAQLDPEAERRLPVLIDLGLAVKDAELVLAGTPTYLAPEVAARFAGVPDPAPIGPKADVFALALTLRQALDAASTEAVTSVDAFVSRRARVAPGAPTRRDLRDLKACFERWLNISPDVRPTAEEFRRELRILTRKEERRARRLALARWLAPTTLAVVALFATTAMVLTREAEHQRIEAHHERVRASQAQARAVSMHTNLEEEKGRRRVVENEFRNSRLTCGELEQRLIRAEQEIVRQQKAAEDTAIEMCKLRKGKNCEPTSATPVSSVSVTPPAEPER
ncbi:MAG TPA: serine/threonine-protein kinase [Polyangiaceae bacterium]|nr:serine/threonine-protein kinase [Polyangiaceae bacterium]